MPGYGFAKVPKSVRAAWGRMIEGYLSQRDELCGVIQVIDVRHPPTRDDITMYEWLKHYRMPTVIVATKADKIPRGRWQKHLKQVREGLHLKTGVPLILFSAQTGQGKEEVWAEIRRLMRSEEDGS